MNSIKIRCIADTKCTLGEGPVWDDIHQHLWWVDILGNRIYRYDPGSESIDWWKTPEHVGFLILKKEGGLIAGLKSGLHDVTLKKEHGVSVSRIDRVDENQDQIRFNDGTCDHHGRIWGCTMDMNEKAPLGKYFCYDNDLNRTTVDEGYAVANGPALSPDGQLLYTVETAGGTALKKGIYVAKSGGVNLFHNRKLLIDWSERPSLPDGLITDEEGNLWIGEFGGNLVRSYSPGGSLELEIEVPGWSVTKPAFGGKNRDILFVTTAWIAAGDDILEEYPLTGGVFAIQETGFKGRPTVYF